jgi:hypothetical protein
MMCVCYALCAAGVFDVADMQLLLRWMDMLARNPKGTDDVKSVSGVLPPVQKLVLQLLGQFNMVGLALGLHWSGRSCSALRADSRTLFPYQLASM